MNVCVVLVVRWALTPVRPCGHRILAEDRIDVNVVTACGKGAMSTRRTRTTVHSPGIGWSVIHNVGSQGQFTEPFGTMDR